MIKLKSQTVTGLTRTALRYIYSMAILLSFNSCQDNLTNSNTFPLDATMIKIKAASVKFNMGSEKWENAEKPIHVVGFTKDFWISITEISQKDYSEVMSSVYPDYKDPVWDSIYGVGERYPAYNISWYDAVLFCNALSNLMGYDTVYTYSSINGNILTEFVLNDLQYDLIIDGFRLPTEAEWEFACRGNSMTDFYWGDSVNGNYLWYNANSNLQSHPVGEKKATSFGLYDLHGNVWEWCNDWFKETYYVDCGDTIIDPLGPKTGKDKTIRGGSWLTGSILCRSSTRIIGNPKLRWYSHGFRIVRTET